MKVQLATSLDTNSSSALVLPVTPGADIVKSVQHYFPDFSSSSEMQANADETIALLHNGNRIDCVCAKNGDYGSMVRAMQVYATKNRKKFEGNATILASHLKENDQFSGAVQGSVLGSYDIGHYKSDSDPSDFDITVVDDQNRSSVMDASINAADTQKEIFHLMNAPSNHKSPLTLAAWATESGKKHGFDVTIIEEKQLKDDGFDALLAVNRGSEIPARFIICDYNPGNSAKTVVLVGKGVTFDTGGVSLKPGHNMHLMKSDMGGAAAVLGAVELCAKQKVKTRVIACVPTTDNSIGTNAIKPGDVIGSYSGKTIEVINTDAEGRLILADGLNYAIEKFSPDIIIDLATLTGSVVRTLGSYCAGLFTHDDALAKGLTKAGETCGERLWRLPLWTDYADDMKSDVADIKNLSDKPVAGAITAAKFLEFFTSEHKHWAHIDIAGTAFKTNGIARNHAATAYGVMLLYTYLNQLS